MSPAQRGKPRRKKPAKASSEAEGVPRVRFMDLRIRMGIDNFEVRVAAAGLETLITYWLIAGEDVVLRSLYENKEVNIVLRGGEHAYFSYQAADPAKRISTYNVVRIQDMRAQWLNKHIDGSASQ